MKPIFLQCVPDNLKIQEMGNEAVRINPIAFLFVPDCLRTQDMCDEIVYTMSKVFRSISDLDMLR